MPVSENIVTRSTPLGVIVAADIDEYPTGYAAGNPHSKQTTRGTLYMIERDAGLGWCFIKLDNPGDDPEYMHVPMDRVTVL